MFVVCAAFTDTLVMPLIVCETVPLVHLLWGDVM